MTLILLVRHGQASFGASDYDRLSELGHRQADLVGARLAATGLTAPILISGSLVRQQDTAEHLRRALTPEGDIETDDRLDEYDPAALGAHTKVADGPPETARERAQDFQDALDRSLGAWIGGAVGAGESHAQFATRVTGVLTELSSSSRSVVAITSAGVIAVATAVVLGLPLERWPAVARVMVNTSVTKLLTSPDGLRLLSFNDHAHLDAEPALRSYR